MRAVHRLTGRTFHSLRVRNFRLFYLGQLVSVSGTWMQTVAQSWLVYQLTGDGVALGTVLALQFVPMLVAGPWGGVVADRFDKRRVLVAAQVAMAVTAGALAAVTLAGVVELWMVYALAFSTGVANVVEMPTRQAFVNEMVGPAELPNAIALNTALFNAGRVVGPSLAAVLIARVGIGWCFAVNAASFVAVIGALVAMRRAELRPTRPVARAKGQVRAGMAYAWSTPALRSTLLLVGVVGTFGFNFPVVLPLLADEVFGQGASAYSVLTLSMGAGSLVGALVTATRGRPTSRRLVGAAFAFGTLMLVAAAAPTMAWEVAVLAASGAAVVTLMATANATVQLNSADAMRGRVMALYGLVFLGTTPLGGPAVGWVSERFGPRAGLALGGLATLAAATATAASLTRAARRRAAAPATAAAEAEVAAAA